VLVGKGQASSWTARSLMMKPRPDPCKLRAAERKR